MSVNNLTINEQAYALITELHLQATGQKASAVVDLSSFISTAQKTLRAGYEPVLNGISIMVSSTLMAIRPYYRKFKGMEYTAEKWGGIIRKISFADTDPTETKAFDLTDGQSVDPWKINKPKVLETRYVGSDVWDMDYTITREQLRARLAGPAELVSFFNAVMLHFSNLREQHLEEMARATVCNMITAKNVINSGADVIHLLTEYNTALGLTGANALTSETVRQPANYPAFVRWLYARVENLSKLMSERSVLFQQPITGYKIVRHTPVEDQRIYINADIMAHMEAEVLSDTYHDNYLKLAETESVTYWQDIKEPLTVKAKPVYIGTDGAVTVAESAQTMTNVIGIMFDRDAMGYNIYDDTMETSPYNQKGKYYNITNSVRIMYTNDASEKVVVLALD